MKKHLAPSAPYIATRQPLSRRHFLRGAGVALSLPMLDAMLPRFAKAQSAAAPAKPRRMFGIMNNLGYLQANYIPVGPGRDYKPSEYLSLIQEHRNDFTVFTGVNLPAVQGSHPTEVAWLTGAPNPSAASFRNTISLDQVVAENIGTLTRFPSLTLSINSPGRGLSFTGGGVGIPPEEKAADIFKQLFVQGSQSEIDAKIMDLENGRSILDTVTDQVKTLERDLGSPDRERIDQFVTSVRSLEERLQASQGWEKKPKPVVTVQPPADVANPAQFFQKLSVMYKIATLVLQTDSCRAISLFVSATGTPAVAGVEMPITEGYHGLSHHGKSPEKMAQHKVLDRANFKALGELMAALKEVKEDGETLLDRTCVLWGSNFQDANAHLSHNLPFIMAGGGFKHGQYLHFDNVRPYPQTNMYLSVLHRLGINADKFSSSTGTCRGLEMT
jgi:hypothetical protein